MIAVAPAKMLAIDNRIGCIAPGKNADILLFNDDMKLKLIMIKGRIWKNTL